MVQPSLKTQRLPRQASSPTPRRRARPQSAALVMKQVPGKGRGIFARRRLAAGTEVLEFRGDIQPVAAFDDLTHALQIGPESFLSASGGIDDYVNHSCQPNCGIRQERATGRIVLVALEDIADGTEITFDYATTQMGGHWQMHCRCGAGTCRGIIGDFADMPAVVRQFYIDRDAVLPFLIAGHQGS